MHSRNWEEMPSFDGNVVTTVQDAVPPISSADPLDPDQYLTEFEIAFQADETSSGFAHAELFYRFEYVLKLLKKQFRQNSH